MRSTYMRIPLNDNDFDNSIINPAFNVSKLTYLDLMLSSATCSIVSVLGLSMGRTIALANRE